VLSSADWKTTRPRGIFQSGDKKLISMEKNDLMWLPSHLPDATPGKFPTIEEQ
jgi:hypothetical protein